MAQLLALYARRSAGGGGLAGGDLAEEAEVLVGVAVEACAAAGAAVGAVAAVGVGLHADQMMLELEEVFHLD